VVLEGSQSQNMGIENVEAVEVPDEGSEVVVEIAVGETQVAPQNTPKSHSKFGNSNSKVSHNNYLLPSPS